MPRFSTAAKGVAALVSGTVAGQLILVGATPLMSRIYSPAEFGQFSALLAIAATIGPAASLKLDAGILLPEDRDVARRLLRAAVGSALCVSAFTGGAVWWMGLTGGGDAWGSIAAAPLWVALMVLTSALFTILTQAALRDGAYRVIARRSPIQATGMAVGQIGLGLVAPIGTSLAGGYLLGRVLGFIPLALASRDLLRRPSDGSYLAATKQYWRLPALIAPSAVLNALGTQAPVLFFAVWFGAALAGELSMAQRLVFLPATLVGAAVGQVFGAELAKRLRERVPGTRRYYLRVSGWASIFAVAVGLVLVLVSPWAFPLVLGEQWRTSGLLAQALSVSAALGLIASPLSQVYQIYQSGASLVIDGSRIVLLAAAVWMVSAFQLDAVAACWALSVAQAMNYVLTWSWALRIVTRKAN